MSDCGIHSVPLRQAQSSIDTCAYAADISPLCRVMQRLRAYAKERGLEAVVSQHNLVRGKPGSTLFYKDSCYVAHVQIPYERMPSPEHYYALIKACIDYLCSIPIVKTANEIEFPRWITDYARNIPEINAIEKRHLKHDITWLATKNTLLH